MPLLETIIGVPALLAAVVVARLNFCILQVQTISKPVQVYLNNNKYLCRTQY